MPEMVRPEPFHSPAVVRDFERRLRSECGHDLAVQWFWWTGSYGVLEVHPRGAMRYTSMSLPVEDHPDLLGFIVLPLRHEDGRPLSLAMWDPRVAEILHGLEIGSCGHSDWTVTSEGATKKEILPRAVATVEGEVAERRRATAGLDDAARQQTKEVAPKAIAEFDSVYGHDYGPPAEWAWKRKTFTGSGLRSSQ